MHQKFRLSTLRLRYPHIHQRSITSNPTIRIPHSSFHTHSFTNHPSYKPHLNNLLLTATNSTSYIPYTLYSSIADPQSEDHYKVLGVDTQCSTDEIKQAYRKLALQYHPDRNQNDSKNAEAKFKNISAAYQTLIDRNKRSEYDMLHRTASSSYARNNRGMGGAKGGTYTGMSFNSDFSSFSRADADKIFTEQFGGKNPFQVMQELEQMIHSFTEGQKTMDKDFGNKYKMPNMSDMKPPKFGDIDWRDDVSDREIEELFSKFGGTMDMNDRDSQTSTTTTTTSTTTKNGECTTTTTKTSYWSGDIRQSFAERVKRADMKAREKMKERAMGAPKPSKPSFFSQFGKGSQSANDIGTLLQRQMNGGQMKGEQWNGPTIKGFDYGSLSEFVDEMMLFQQNEFERKLQTEERETGLLAMGKQKLRQNAERVLFNFTHKIRGIMARGMLRKLKQTEDEQKK